MKQIKNYTTRDWLKQEGACFCSIALAMEGLRRLFDGNYLVGSSILLGAVGWYIVYVSLLKEVERKNR